MVPLGWENLSGTLPEELGFLDLATLMVNGGSISGTLPSFLADFPNLENLSLNDNCFTGTIPERLPDIPNLSVLQMYSNKYP